MTQRFDGESSTTPSLEPTAERMEVFVTTRAQQERHPSAGRLSGLRAVENDLATLRDQLMRLAQPLRRDPTRSRDSVRVRLEVQLRPQVDDDQWVASLHPSLELDRVEARFPEVAQEAAPSCELDGDVEDQSRHDRDEQRRSETGVRRRN